MNAKGRIIDREFTRLKIYATNTRPMEEVGGRDEREYARCLRELFNWNTHSSLWLQGCFILRIKKLAARLAHCCFPKRGSVPASTSNANRAQIMHLQGS